MVRVKLVQGKRFHYNGWKINKSEEKEIPSEVLELFPNFFQVVIPKKKILEKKEEKEDDNSE